MKKVFLVLASFLVIALGFSAYMGAFSSVHVKEGEFGPYSFFYKPFIGPYEEVGPLFQEVHEIFEKKSIEIESMAGIYYDDPKTVEKSSLRSEIGAILNKADAQKHLNKLLQRGLQFKTLPRQNYISTEFPYRNMISIYIGLSKAYPALTKYAHEKGHPEHSPEEEKEQKKKNFAMEIYTKNKILYLMKGL